MADSDAKFDQVAGKVKETTGKVTGDKEVETEGKMQNADGHAAEKLDDAKATLKGVADHVTGKDD